MDRTLFFKQEFVNAGDGEFRPELDFLNNSLEGFVITRQPRYYRVVQGDLSVPDAIAYKMYGSERYWWVVCLANDISDCCKDIYVGQLLIIPDLLDIYDFFKTYRIR